VGKAIDKVRAQEVKQLKAKGEEPVLTHSRWCFLKRPENLRRRHELTIAKYVLEKWCNSILHGMNHAVFGYRPFLYQTL